MSGTTLVNICFHGIGIPERDLEPGESDYWISPSLYERVLDDVTGRDDVRISFDDGNRSDVEIALGALLRRGLTATFFVLAGRLGLTGSLAVDDVRQLRDSGMAIGTHGMDHRPWRALDPAARHRELVEAREILVDAAEGPVDEAALPLGRYDRTVISALKSLNYRAVHTSDRRRARLNAWMQPRYSIRRGDTIESIRNSVLAPASRVAQVQAEAVGLVKRLR